MNIKELIKSNNLKQWQVAEKAGINEFTLSRLLRRPEKIPQKQLETIKNAIQALTLNIQDGETHG